MGSHIYIVYIKKKKKDRYANIKHDARLESQLVTFIVSNGCPTKRFEMPAQTPAAKSFQSNPIEEAVVAPVESMDISTDSSVLNPI
jgi:hypothetical protein